MDEKIDFEEVSVDFEVPYLFQVEDSLEGDGDPYYIQLEECPAELYFKKLPKGGEGIKIAGQMIGDRLGNVSTTAVRIHFGHQLVESIPEERIEKTPPDSVVFQSGSHIQGARGYIIEAAVGAINRFTEVYRQATASYWMRRLFPHEIFNFRLIEIHQNRENDKTHIQYSNSPYEGFGSVIDQETEKSIRRMLQNGAEIPVYARVEMETLNQISIGEYSLAVLNAQRNFEMWAKNVTYALLKNEYGESKAEDLMIDREGQWTPIRGTLAYLDQHLDASFRETEEYNRWDNAYDDIRNEVAHAGKVATNAEANEMYTACQQAQLRIFDTFEEELQGTALELSKRDVPDNSME